MSGVPSPCIQLCKLDEKTGLCLGCLRTLNEIASWGASDDRARQSILAAVAKRRLRLQHDAIEEKLRCNGDDHKL